MAEYRNQSPHLKFQNVDPQEKPEVAKEYGATHIGDVIVASGPRKQTIAAQPSSRRFRKRDVTSAILKVTRDKVKMVCFVTRPRGERSRRQSGKRLYAASIKDSRRKATTRNP